MGWVVREWLKGSWGGWWVVGWVVGGFMGGVGCVGAGSWRVHRLGAYTHPPINSYNVVG